MRIVFKVIGVCIVISSIFTLTDPSTYFFTLPIVFGMGFLVYGIGVIIEMLENLKT